VWLPLVAIVSTNQATVTIGSNNQTIPLIFDTGSDTTWVNPDCSKIPNDTEHDRDYCLKQPRYDPFSSNTAAMYDKCFNFTYGSGHVLGSYFKDDVKVGSAVAKNAMFGVAVASDGFPAGILGAGIRASNGPPTLIEALAAQGQINSYAFSVNYGSKNETGK
jgi:hypothetical protein